MASESSTSNCGANDEVYLDALEPSEFPTRPPPGTSAAVSPSRDVITLMEIFNRVRLRVCAAAAVRILRFQAIDADGTIVPSDAECKQGMDFAYNGQYGYHPL